MITLYDFSQEIKRLKGEKKFHEVLDYFKNNKSHFTDEEISKNVYLIADIITALRQTGNVDHAFRFMDVYKVHLSESTNDRILTAYGWLLYSKFKAENNLGEVQHCDIEGFYEGELVSEINYHYDKSETLQKIEQFLPLIFKISNEYAYTVGSRLFFSVLKVEKQKRNANWKFISEFCDLVTPDRLSTDCETTEFNIKGKKKQLELASDRENWFAYKSKALMKLKKFEECIDISKNALHAFDKFHYSNDTWFALRIALSRVQLGNPKDAILELEAILKRKPEWFIQYELAKLYKESGDTDKALEYALTAINNFGDIEYKVGLLILLGELYSLNGENETAAKHFVLSRKIRESKEWKIPENHILTLKKADFGTLENKSYQELLVDLKKLWRPSQIESGSDVSNRLMGMVKTILPNKISGFISGDNSRDYFFIFRNIIGDTSDISIGQQVKFSVEKSFDRKKGVESEMAVKITIL